MGNLNSPSQYLISVFYLNSISAASPGHGAALNPGKRLSLVDSTGNSPFSTIDNGTVNFLSINSPSLNGQIYQPNAAEVLGVLHPSEPAGTLTANTIYSFRLSQWNPYLAQWISRNISYDTGNGNPIVTGNATTAWYTQINEAGFQVTMTGEGTQTLVITAAVGYPIIYMTGLTNITAAASATVGVPSVGISEGLNNTLGDLNYLNKVGGVGNTFASYTGYISTNAYDIYTFTCLDALGNSHLVYILVNIGSANYSAFTTYFLETILELGGSTPNTTMIQLATAPENNTTT